MSLDRVIANAVLDGQSEPVAIGIADGRIAVIEPSIEADCPVHDAKGDLVTAGLIDCHIHLDKTHLTDRCVIKDGTLGEAIRLTRDAKAGFTVEDVYARAMLVARSAVSHGTTAMRSYVEVDPRAELRSFEALLQVKQELLGVLDLEICAFAQEGLTNEPATLDFLTEALGRGATVVGGCPYTDPEPEAHVDLIFNLAERFGVPADFHLDFDLDPTTMTLPYVLAETRRRGFDGRVVVGHVTKLAAMPPDQLRPLADEIAEAGVAVVALPATDLFINGRDSDHLVPRGVAPLLALDEAGVTVSIGTNNVMNPFTPYGDASLLRLANLYANVAQAAGERTLRQVFAMVGTHAARVLGCDWGLAVGSPADLVQISATNAASAVAGPGEARVVWKAGRPVAKRQSELLLDKAR